MPLTILLYKVLTPLLNHLQRNMIFEALTATPAYFFFFCTPFYKHTETCKFLIPGWVAAFFSSICHLNFSWSLLHLLSHHATDGVLREKGLLKVLSKACWEVVIGLLEWWWWKREICSQDLISEPSTRMLEAKACLVRIKYYSALAPPVDELCTCNAISH